MTGGAIYISTNFILKNSSYIKDSTFTGISVTQGGILDLAFGKGVLLIENCQFTGNKNPLSYGILLGNYGDDTDGVETYVKFLKCTISNNSALYLFALHAISYRNKLYLDDCTVSQNQSAMVSLSDESYYYDTKSRYTQNVSE
jgi:hypothetical protein